MRTKLKTAPSVEPISLTEAKLHLRVTHSTEDDMISSLIVSARRQVEHFTRRKLINQTWYGYLDQWPGTDELILPFGNVQSVTAITYTDTASTGYTMTATDYAADTVTEPSRIMLSYGKSWPSVSLHPLNPIRIEWVCGYGTAGSNVPEPLRQAMKLFLTDLYENRENTVISASGWAVVLPTRAAEHLMYPYIAWWNV